MVTAEMIIPKPIDNTISSRTTSGINNNHHVTCMLVVPVIKNTAQTITNNAKFSDDIWQYDAEFTTEQWKETIDGFVDIISEAKELLEEIQEEECMEDYDFGDDKLYQLGDIINMLSSIDVKVSGRR